MAGNLKNKTSVLRFTYSYPYERTLLFIAGKKPSKSHDELGFKKASFAQKIWNKYDKDVLKLFKEMYKIKIPEKFIKVWVSLILPNSFSDPLTISLKHSPDIEDNPRSKRALVYTTIHELAHYFAYTRNKGDFFNRLHARIQKLDYLGARGANLHYLIQAVEFGIIGEVFGRKFAEYVHSWVIGKWKKSEYSISAQKLREDKVPLGKTCLRYIEKKVLGKSRLLRYSNETQLPKR